MGLQSTAVTDLLLEWGRGNRDALHRLLPLVDESLHDIARAHLRRERPDHSLEPSALVNELYLRLVDQRQASWRDRAHFFGVAAQIMRNILVDHARRRQSDKRGGQWTRVTLGDDLVAGEERQVDLIVLDDSLTRLAAIFPQQARIVELRYFSGMTIEETAEVLELSPATIKREWSMARAWLRREIIERSTLRGAS